MSFAQLLYVSRSLLPSDGDGAGLREILVSAKRSNEVLGITGCLASWGPWFVQILEGNAEAIAVAMARVRADTRHTGITVRLQREVGTRSFPSWRMAHVDAGDHPIGDPMDLPVVILLSELMRLAEGELLSPAK
jgi:hypothetical protein